MVDMEFERINRKLWSEKYIFKYFKSDYDIIVTFPGRTFSEKIYNCLNGFTEIHKCPVCGKETTFLGVTKGYCLHCSQKCSYVERDNKTKRTKLERYGDENYNNRDKSKETALTNHGTLDFVNSTKAKKTKLERYGDENYSNREKSKATCLERFGVEYSIQSKEIQDKAKQTKLERYGDENYNNSEQIVKTNIERYGSAFNMDAVKKSLIENYGVKTPFESEDIRNKAKQTILERYNVENPINIPGVKEKARKSHALKILARTQEQFPDVIDITCGMWRCKCNKDCDKCQEKAFEIPAQSYRYRTKYNYELCTKLNPVEYDKNAGTSIELFIRNILDKYNIEYETNVRNVLSKRELDIYIPSKHIGIECNGMYWHSSVNKSKIYHYQKYKDCEAKGIQLLMFWENDIKNNPEKVESILLSSLGVYKYRIYARDCEIRSISSKECNEFLNMYHLQNAVNSSVRYGLYYNNELISVMSFGHSRTNRNEQWELYRYCVKSDYQIVGGASKLFKHYLSDIKPDEVVSFSSNDISNGNLYKKLGFDYVSDTIGYWYIDKALNKYHRYNFRKSELVKNGFDSRLTETQIMSELNLLKIYDSGQTKWLYKNK